MLKRPAVFLVPLLMGLLACRALFPNTPATPTAPATQEATAPTTDTLSAVATPETGTTALAPGQDFTLARIHPEDGELHGLLAAEVKKAQALGQTPFIEFDATWCPPCQAITASLEDRNELMLSAYSGIYLIHADVDEWSWDNSAAGFPVVKAIPIFFALDGQGNPTGAVISGGAWKEDIPENIAPVLTEFFHP